MVEMTFEHSKKNVLQNVYEIVLEIDKSFKTDWAASTRKSSP